MKRIATYLILTLLGTAPLYAMPNQMTFQGTLKQNGVPVNSPPPVNMVFSFVDASGATIPGTQPIPMPNVQVTNGLFAVSLSLDPTIPWDKYQPFIHVLVAGQALIPDQPINANAYSMVANTVVDGSITYAKLAPSVQSVTTPPGAVIAFAGSTPPTGWLLCDGSAVSRTTYSGLFQSIGITWGSGDGVTTFNLPDLRGRAPIGAGQGASLTNRTLGQTLGEESHTLQSSELPVNGYTVNDPGHSHATSDSSGFFTEAKIPSGALSFGAGANFGIAPNTSVSYTGISVSVPSGGNAHNVMQPSAVVNFIIKY
jgi:microcystin-dependent protein